MLEKPTGIAGATSDVGRADIVVLPSGEVRRRLADARRDCETLRENIYTVQRCLRTLESISADIDNKSARERLQRQMVLLNRLLLRRLDELSDIDRLLKETLRSACGSS
jgi:hypothetical protein